MKSYFFIALILFDTLFISHLNAQTAIIVVKYDLINQFKDSEIPRIYKDLRNIRTSDVSESKKKGFIKWRYSVTSCHGQLSEFNPSQVQINLHGSSNTIEIKLKDFKFHYNCHARVKSLGISISGNVNVTANVPLIRVVLSPGLFDREKGFKSILFRLQQSHVDINPKRDMKLRLSIKNCPRFIESAIEHIVIRTMNNKIRNTFNDVLRESVTKGLQRLAEKTHLQTVIPDTNVALTYSFYKPPLITNHQIILYLDSHFYPLNIGLENGKIPVPQRFRDPGLQLPQIDSQQGDIKSNNSYLFYHVSLINSGLWAAAVAKRTYVINNQFMRLFNSRQIINTRFLRQLIPEIGFYDEEDITVKVFLVPDEKYNTAKFQQNKILLDLKFQAQFQLSKTQQEIMSIVIHAGFLFTDLRGEEGDGQNSMMDVYGLIEDITLIDFDILHTSQALTEETYDNMKTIIESFFILGQALVNRDFMRYPYQIPVKVLDIVKVDKAKAYFSQRFGLITAGITGQ